MHFPYRVVIFDMDDTLVTTTTTWKPAEMQLFALLGGEYDPAIVRQYKGMNASAIGRVIHAHLRPAGYSPEDCGRLLKELLIDTFRKPISPMPGADVAIRSLARRYDIAIASGSPEAGIRLVMEQFDWTSCVQVIVSSEDVPRGKPEPDVFLEAARRLDVDPSDALVIEDSIHGVRAARRAGMTCFAVPSGPDPAIAGEADRAFSSLEEIAALLAPPERVACL